MASPTEYLNNLVQKTATIATKYAKQVVYIFAFLTVVSFIVVGTKFKLNSDLAALLPEDYPSVQTRKKVFEKVGGVDRLIILLSGGKWSEKVRIANNMANVNTTAYKRSVAHFQDLLYQSVGSP